MNYFFNYLCLRVFLLALILLAAATIKPVGVKAQCSTIWYEDHDHDGYGNSVVTQVACSQPSGFVSDSTDCNDNDVSVFYARYYYADADGDNFTVGSAVLICGTYQVPSGYRTYSSYPEDCDDTDPSVHYSFYPDADHDGVGAMNSQKICTAQNIAPYGYASGNTDCNDTDAAIGPYHAELCNSMDDNCNGIIDDQLRFIYYNDADGDGYGDASSPFDLCYPQTGYVVMGGDCDDGDANVNPAAMEICNTIDDNCSGTTDELITSQHVMYGANSSGGQYSLGDIVRYDKIAHTYTVVASFSSATGGYPFTGLVQAPNGKLYGTTYNGGANNKGTIYEFDPNTNTITDKHDFVDLVYSYEGELLLSVNGKFYGCTAGSIYEFDPVTSSFTTLYTLDSYTDGGAPAGKLVQTADGKFYGTVHDAPYNSGGSYYGAIFSFDPANTTFTVLHNFNGTDGYYPLGLTKASNGKLYGATFFGGTNGQGAVYMFDPSSNSFQFLADMYALGSYLPYAQLTTGNDGKLYGTTLSSVSTIGGIVYDVNPANDQVTVRAHLDQGYSGYIGLSALTQSSDGLLYGISAPSSTYNDHESVFTFNPVTNALAYYVHLDASLSGNTIGPLIELPYGTPSTWYVDNDGDGYGAATSTIASFSQPCGYIDNDDDCDDVHNTVHPGATEICGNSIDDNCNNQIDENCGCSSTITPSGTIAVCHSVPVTLQANTGTGIIYQWYKGNNAILGATNSTYVTTKRGSFKVIETNGSCGGESPVTTVMRLLAPPAFIITYGSLDLCSTGYLDMRANGGANATYTYQWYKSSLTIVGATNRNFTVSTAGDYSVVVTYTNGCSRTSSQVHVISSCKEASMKATGAALEVYPNPGNGNFIVHLQFADDLNTDAELQILNTLGQMVYRNKTSIVNGELLDELKLSETISSGNYFIRVLVNNTQYTTKLIVEK